VEISRRYSRDTVELSVAGRLDGYWSDHLASALDEEIRLGRHHLLLDLSDVVFLSSAGIGVLIKSYNELESIRGSLSIWKASERVRKVIEICGLDQMLLAKEDVLQADKRVLYATSSLIRHVERPEASFDVYQLAPEAGLTCRVVGDAKLIEGCGFSKENCYSMDFPDSSFAIGLGALGENFDECRSRFGEFIAVAGAVAYQPTDGTNVPDHLVAAGKSLSHVQVCYGIACEELAAGPFSMLLRFQAGQGGPISLTELVDSCLEIAESPRLGIVMVAEAAGLVGASLRRSPAQTKAEPGPFEFPQVREWLSFTAERTHTRSMTLVAGVALRDEAAVMAPVVRPLNSSVANSVGSINGHFHAAAFSYHPLQNGKIDLKTTVRKLFERETVEDVLHLLSDDRVIAGAGESEFIRGACWIGPIRDITAKESNA